MPKLIYPFKNYGSDPVISVTQGFGGNPEIYAQFGMKGHNGWDFRCLTGTPLIAVHDGKVEFYQETVNYGTGYGKNVRLYFEEDGFTWDCVYGHLDGYSGVNREVKRGEVIGYSGNTGFSTGPHLHFGIRKILNGQIIDYNNGYFGYIDPGPLFRKETMRLVNDNGTVYLVGDKGKIGFADENALNTFKEIESLIEDGSTDGIPQTNIFETGLTVHK